MFSRWWILIAQALAVGFGGCGSPNQPNIALRKKIQAQESQIADLQRAHAADAAAIRSLQDQKGSLPTLPQDRLDRLFTVAGLSLGRLTGPADLDPNEIGDDGVKVYVVPTDQSGQPIKAAGTFTIDLFDLARQSDNLIGHWDFTIDQARAAWFGRALLYTYIFSCPWNSLAEHSELTLRVTFHDELTGREFVTEKVIPTHAAP